MPFGKDLEKVIATQAEHRGGVKLTDERNQALSTDETNSQIRIYYLALFHAWGPQNWWPAKSPFEVIVGAYLTQNTAWTNVEKALANLRSAKLLSVKGMRKVSLTKLESLIRPSGYFRQKAKRLKTFVRFLYRQHGGSLSTMLTRPTAELRKELLTLNGIVTPTATTNLFVYVRLLIHYVFFQFHGDAYRSVEWFAVECGELFLARE